MYLFFDVFLAEMHLFEMQKFSCTAKMYYLSAVFDIIVLYNVYTG